MSAQTINAKIKHRFDTSTNWVSVNPILLAGEMGIESDTKKFKFGDGVSNWNTLEYSFTGGGGGATQVPCYPVGVPFPWISAEARPNGTLLCDGSSFSLTDYPELTVIFPSGVLPDLRGVGLRGLDRGRGLDATREIGSYQADDQKSHSHTINDPQHGHSINDPRHSHPQNVTANSGGTGVRKDSSADISGLQSYAQGINTDPAYTGISINANSTGISINSTGGSETRGKNVAVDWLVFAVTVGYDISTNNANALTLGGYPVSHFMENVTLAAVAISGSYNDLFDKPTLADVASTGSYNDLNNKPWIPPYFDGGASFGWNGYQILSNGFIIQWGIHETTMDENTAPQNIYFPIAFPKYCLNITGGGCSETIAPKTFQAGGVRRGDRTYFVRTGADNGYSRMMWVAFGY